MKTRMMAAAYALLGVAPAGAAAAEAEAPKTSGLNVDASLLYYDEADRITIVEPVVRMSKEFSEGRELDVLLTVDTISGATPNGTLPGKPATVTSPSGGGASATKVGDVPTTVMTDTRYAADASWTQPLAETWKGTAGASVSTEGDFTSFGARTSVAKDLNQKATTLSLGISGEFDQSNPIGGVPTPFGASLVSQGASASKTVVGALAGLTQVIDARTLMQLNFLFNAESGYLNDPYKQLSQVDPVTGVPQNNVYENRPRARNSQSLYWLTKHAFAGAVAGASYRYYTDDWGIRSHTVDLTYNWRLGERSFLEPHFRFYRQTQANFYQVGLLNGAALPSFASADYRLSRFDAVTGGLRWGHTFDNDSRVALRLEYYTQIGKAHPDSPADVGVQRTFVLFPKLEATIFQVEWAFNPGRIFASDATRR